MVLSLIELPDEHAQNPRIQGHWRESTQSWCALMSVTNFLFKGVVVETNTPCFNQSSFEPPKPSTKIPMIVGLYGTKAIDF